MRIKLLALYSALFALLCMGLVPAHAATESPHNLVISNIQDTQFNAKWQTVTDADQYQVYLNGTLKATSPDAAELITGLTPGTSYLVQLKAQVNGEWSPLTGPERSGSKTVKTTGSSTTPPPPPPPGPGPVPPPPPPPPPAATGSAATNFGWGTPIAAGSDEFNYSGAPATAKWNNYNTSGHAGKGRRLQSQSVVNGAELVQTGLPNGDTGYLSSKYRPGTMYGKWEIRLKVNDRDSEYHPVQLLWPDTGGDSSTDDEVDFSESTSDKSLVKFFLHYGTPGQGLQTTASKAIDMKQFHNYAVEWSASGVRGYIDGVKWFEDLNASHNPGQPMHQAIQLDWFPDGTATTTSTMTVDWTRAYK
jgi:hypothetical protein